MTSLDQDVAAILGLPSERLAAPSSRPRRRGSRPWRLLGLGVTALAALGVAALTLMHGRRSEPVALALEARLQRPPSPTPAMPKPSQNDRRVDVIAAKPSSHENAPPAPKRSPNEAAATPPAPSPPSASTAVTPPLHRSSPKLAEAETAPAPTLSRPGAGTLRSPRTERLAQVQAEALVEPEPQESVPEWRSQPDGEDVARAYPSAALRDGTPGSVVLGCTERTDGSVTACHVLSEAPVDSGFGRAALRLSRQFRFSPVVENGRPVEAEVRIPYDFSVVD